MARIKWHQKQVIKASAAAVDAACDEGADLVLADAKRLVPVKTGKLRAAIQKRKSKFKDGGYIVGVFDDAAAGGRWQDTLGARAVFVEFGHAGPGRGKGTVDPTGVKGKWESGAKVVPPKPFLRPALKKNRTRIRKLIQDGLE